MNQTIPAICLDDSLIPRQDCEHCSIRSRMLFAPLQLETIADFLWPIHHVVSPAKTTLFHQGQPPQSLFSIRRGFLKLTQTNESGNARIVRLLGPGACIGLEALLGDHYHQQAEAITELDYCVIPVTSVLNIEKTQPALYEELQKQWNHQLQQADNWLTELLSGTIKQRFCRFILMLEEIQRLPARQIILISNQDIASILGSSEESISRIVVELRKTGLMERIEKRLYRLDIEELHAIASS